MNGSLASPGGPDGFADVNYLHGMERLVHAVQELSLTRSLVDVQRIVRRSARQLVGCDGTTFVLREREICYYADEDAMEPLWKGSRFSMRSCVSGWTMLNRAAAVIPDIYLDARIPHEAYRPTFVKSLARVGGDEFCVLISEQVADSLALRAQIDRAFHHFDDAVAMAGRTWCQPASGWPNRQRRSCVASMNC